jgi:hypothetical protein
MNVNQIRLRQKILGMPDLAYMSRDEITDTLEKMAKDIRIGNIGHPSWGEAKPLRNPLLTHNFFIILAKSPNWDTEDFGDLVLRMKSRKDREILCAVTDERNYDFLFNTLHEAGKKEIGKFLFENIEMVEDTNPSLVGIHCPLCGFHQIVPRDEWHFQSTEGHGHTCGSGKCPSHTYMVLDDYDQVLTDLLSVFRETNAKGDFRPWNIGHIESLIEEFRNTVGES